MKGLRIGNMKSPGYRLLFLALASAMACGNSGSGCAGCGGIQPIPGGFPTEQRFQNGVQLRLSEKGIAFVEENFATLLTSALGTGATTGSDVTFPVPSLCDGSQKLCCNKECKATVHSMDVKITPFQSSAFQIYVKLNMSTDVMPFTYSGFNCSIQYTSAAQGSKTVDVEAQIDLEIDQSAGGALKVARRSVKINHLSCDEVDDVDISGGVLCDTIDLVLGIGLVCDWALGPVRGAIQTMMEDAIDETLAEIPTGSEGRFSLATLLQSISPSTEGNLDYSFFMGQYATTTDGATVGSSAGFRAPAHNPCVPDCEKPDAQCSPPSGAAIVASEAIRTETRPDGGDYHVGISIHRLTLERAAYAFYSAGGFCVDFGRSRMSGTLNTGVFGLLLPSLKRMAGEEPKPLIVAIRPQSPPTLRLGTGAYSEDKDGKVTVGDPLVEATFKDLKVDVFAMVDERYLRIFSVVGKAAIPLLLFADADGKLRTIVGDLSDAFEDTRVIDSDLLEEDPARLEEMLPSLIGIAARNLAESIPTVELPEIQGIHLDLDKGSIVSVDNKQALAIFAKLAILKSTSLDSPYEASRVDTKATLEQLELPSTEQFSITRRTPGVAPRAILSLGATLPPHLRDQPLEWTYRVDGGFYRPFVRSSRLVVEDPLFWLQGTHRVEVMARVVGRPLSADQTPAEITLHIDTQPPRVVLKRSMEGVEAMVSDLVSESKALQLSWKIGDAPFGPYGSKRHLEVDPNTPVSVRVRDRAGNTAERHTDPAVDPITEGFHQTEGCNAAGAQTGFGIALLAWLMLLTRRKRTQRRNRSDA